jgi:hypothetical protein
MANDQGGYPDGLTSSVPEPAKSIVIALWRLAARLERKGQRERAQACYRRIIAIKDPIREALGHNRLGDQPVNLG